MSEKRKNIIGRVSIVVLAVMLMSVMGIFSVNAAAKMKINKKKATIYVGKTVKLKVKNANKKVKWTSSKKSVATVSKKGKVKGKKAGKAVITAKVGKKKFKCKVTVKKRYKGKVKSGVKNSIISILKTYGETSYNDDGMYYYLGELDYDDDYNSLYTQVAYYPSKNVVRITLLYNDDQMTYFEIRNEKDSYCDLVFYDEGFALFGEGYLYKNKINQSYGVSFYNDNFGNSTIRNSVSKLATTSARYTLSTFDIIMIKCGSSITHKDLGFYF